MWVTRTSFKTSGHGSMPKYHGEELTRGPSASSGANKQLQGCTFYLLFSSPLPRLRFLLLGYSPPLMAGIVLKGSPSHATVIPCCDADAAGTAALRLRHCGADRTQQAQRCTRALFHSIYQTGTSLILCVCVDASRQIVYFVSTLWEGTYIYVKLYLHRT